MNQPDYPQILEYAANLKEDHPTISTSELKKSLLAQFACDKKTQSLNAVGCVADPLGDQLNLLAIIIHSLRKIITQDRVKLMSIQDKIDKAIQELMTCK